MDHAYISKLESGRANPALDTLSKIATGLDVHIARFFDGKPEKDYTLTRF